MLMYILHPTHLFGPTNITVTILTTAYNMRPVTTITQVLIFCNNHNKYMIINIILMSNVHVVDRIQYNSLYSQYYRIINTAYTFKKCISITSNSSNGP